MKSCPRKVRLNELDKERFDREEEEFEKNGGCKSLLQKNEKKPKKCIRHLFEECMKTSEINNLDF